MAASLARALPKPKYTGEDEELVTHAKSRGTKVVGAGGVDDSQVVLRVREVYFFTISATSNNRAQRSGPPPYGNRAGWRPRSAEDFGDGGAFPEIPVAQYPLDMGRKTTSSSNALALQVNAEGKVKYDAIARRGHSDKRIIHSEFKDLIPLRQRADAGELSLERPSEEEIAATRERTQAALTTLINGAVAAQKPKTIAGTSRPAPTYVSYTPDNQMGDQTAGKTRIIKIVQRQQDPVEPPKHKHKKVPRGPPSPPPPVMHSPPRKLTAEDQEMWKIPPPVSNWKNPKGYTVPLDKRLAADGRGLQDVTINDKFAQLSETLASTDRLAREEIKQRALMQQKLAEKEKLAKEEHLRSLAQKARQDRAQASRGGQRRMSSRHSASPSRSRSASYSDRSYSRSPSPDADDSARRERERARRERQEERERSLRQSRMGTERRLQQMARAQNRDIGEKVALGIAKPTQNAESMYDSRLFNQTSGFDTGFNEDRAYDKPLFAQREAIDSIYRPNMNQDDEEDATGETLEKIQKSGQARFGEVLGRGTFKGSENAERREGPVLFEADKGASIGSGGAKADDPFGIDAMISEAREQAEKSSKRYGMQESEGRAPKRARVEDDES